MYASIKKGGSLPLFSLAVIESDAPTPTIINVASALCSPFQKKRSMNSFLKKKVD